MTRVKTDAQERAKLRLNEERRVKHAQETLNALMQRHNLDERDVFELHTICLRLITAIKTQHIKDTRYAKLKARFPVNGMEGF